MSEREGEGGRGQDVERLLADHERLLEVARWLLDEFSFSAPETAGAKLPMWYRRLKEGVGGV